LGIKKQLWKKPYVIKLLMNVIYKWAKHARMFVPGRPFHSVLLFGNKARTHTSGAPIGEPPDFTHKH
jgi:hypothetical protein